MDDLAKEEVDSGKQLDDIRSMSLNDADRERLVSSYLNGLIRAIEPDQEAVTPDRLKGCKRK